jgi:hypothetical protein
MWDPPTMCCWKETCRTHVTLPLAVSTRRTRVARLTRRLLVPEPPPVLKHFPFFRGAESCV